jgi:DNA-binding NtrC family response regulator
VVLAETDTIGLDEFPQVTAQLGSAGRGVAAAPDTAQAPSVAPEFEPVPLELPVTLGSIPDAAVLAPAFPAEMLPMLDVEGEIRPLDEVEADLIKYAITHYRGQMSEVARRLQIGRSTLYRKLDALGLNNERGEENGEAVAAERQA